MTAWLNQFDRDGTTEAELRIIEQEPVIPPAKRAAAKHILMLLESADLADFDDFFGGRKSLRELREAGINTRVVKKIRNTEFGVEIELHPDRAAPAFDRIMDRTEGLAKARLEASHTISAPAEESVRDLVEKLRAPQLPAPEDATSGVEPEAT